MAITPSGAEAPWLLLVFTLPASKASKRVQIWRKLQKFGSVPFRNAGYILPNHPLHQERFEWLATAIRGYGGDASVLQIRSIDEASPSLQQEVFRLARSVDYSALMDEIEKLKPSARGTSGQIPRLKRRFPVHLPSRQRSRRTRVRSRSEALIRLSRVRHRHGASEQRRKSGSAGLLSDASCAYGIRGSKDPSRLFPTGERGWSPSAKNHATG